MGMGFTGEYHFTAGGGEYRVDGDGDGLVEEVSCVGDDDHGAIGEVADGLTGIFARFEEFDGEGIAWDGVGIEGFGEGVEVKPFDIMEFGDLCEVVVGGEDLGFKGLGEEDELGIDLLAIADGRLIDAEVDMVHGADAVEGIEPFASACLAIGIGGIGDGLEFVEDESGDDDAVAEESALADAGEAAIDEGGGIDEDEGDIDIMGDEADVGDDEVKLVLTTEGDDGPEVHEDDEEGKADEVEILGEDNAEVILIIERELKEGGSGEEVGAGPSDEEAESECGEAAEGKALEEDIDEDDEGTDGGADEDGARPVGIPFGDGEGDEPCADDAEEEEGDAEGADGGVHGGGIWQTAGGISRETTGF